MEKVLCVQGVASGAGCSLCGQIPGWGKSQLDCVCHQGHRPLLPLGHVTRYIGQSGRCCPPEYYTDNDVRKRDMEEQSKYHDERLQGNFGNITSLTVNYRQKTIVQNFVATICSSDKVLKDQVGSILNGNDSWTSFYDEPYNIDSFLDSMYYPHCDVRPHVEFQRVDNATYRQNAMIVKLNPGLKESSGVKGLWVLGIRLNYMDFAKHVNYDPFHVMMNLATCVLKHLLRMRSISALTIQYCSHHCMFPFLSSDYFPWALPNGKELHIQRYLDAVHIPMGISDEYRFLELVTRFGHFKGVQKIHLVESCMDYITFCSEKIIDASCRSQTTSRSQTGTGHYLKEAKAYLHLYRMMSNLISRLQQPVFVSMAQIDKLHRDALEAVEDYSGMFPPSESRMTMHEIVHMALHIKEQGPLRDWSTLPSERALSYIKKQYEPLGKNRVALNIEPRYLLQFALARKYQWILHDAEVVKALHPYHNKDKLSRIKLMGSEVLLQKTKLQEGADEADAV
eukprot:gene31164-37664_t